MTNPSGGGRGRCVVCNQRRATVGVLCGSCHARLDGSVRLAPEQIILQSDRGGDAALIDRWARAHRLDPITRIGRVVEGSTLCILSPEVSRHHSTIALHGRTWTIRDLGSSNGTYVDGVRIQGDTKLLHGAHVRFGDVPFFFLEDVSRHPIHAFPRANSPTLHPDSPFDVNTPVELKSRAAPPMPFVLFQPTGGGGALAIIGGRQVQLAIAQLDLIRVLAERMVDEEREDPSTRGFVTIHELLEKLSLESTAADADNVRQLVRRVRKLLSKVGLGDLIESRHGRGYRLRVVPRLA